MHFDSCVVNLLYAKESIEVKPFLSEYHVTLIGWTLTINSINCNYWTLMLHWCTKYNNAFQREDIVLDEEEIALNFFFFETGRKNVGSSVNKCINQWPFLNYTKLETRWRWYFILPSDKTWLCRFSYYWRAPVSSDF